MQRNCTYGSEGGGRKRAIPDYHLHSCKKVWEIWHLVGPLPYHGFHQLGIIDPGELLVFHLCKHGSLNVRPVGNEDVVEYLVLALNYYVNQVHIYKRQMGQDVAVYDMSAV